MADVGVETCAATSDDELLSTYPGHGIDREAAFHFRGWLDRRLLLLRCGACAVWHHPPGPICPACWSSDVVPTESTGAGVIHLITSLHQGPLVEGVDYSTPYSIVTVDLDEQSGLRYTAGLVDKPDGKALIGRRARLAWVERGGAPIPAYRLDRRDDGG